jgi:hypothetical protein
VSEQPGVRRRLAGAAMAALIVAAGVPLAGAQLLDRVIAVVSGTIITLSDARAAIAFGFVETAGARDPIEAAMRWLVDRQLVIDEAGRSGFADVDPKALGESLDTIRKRFPSEPEYRASLARVGFDDAGVRQFAKETLLSRQYLESRFDSVLPPTDEDLREYYAAHAGRFVRDGRQLTFEQAQQDLRPLVQQERRQQAMAAWMERLRRRADVNEIYQAILK